MPKRSADEVADGNEAYLKRQKITQNTRQVQVPTEEIRSARQLRQILAFDQDTNRSKHAIQSFKSFLDNFADSENENASRTSILKEYLESQKSTDETDKEAVYLTDLMQTWSFASQSNDEGLLSAVPAVLALLFRIISGTLEFSGYGLILGRTLLQKRQGELMARGLTSNKVKPWVISPVLRLLREMCLFDGGVFSRQIFQKRDHTLKGLARNLSIRYEGDGVEDPKKPSVRTNALRFLLAMIKFLPTDSKRELLSQRDIISAITKDIRDDPPFLVRDTLATLKSHVLLDDGLPRDAKTKIVNATSLGRIALLYRYNQAEDELSDTTGVDTLAHEFLTLACTSPDMGVLMRQTGFYPRGVDADDAQDLDIEGSSIHLGLDSIEWMERFKEKVPVRNTILSEFIQNLRPWSNTKQSELLVSILKSAPELIADYYYGKKDFSFDPKLTATWIGYSAFIYSTLGLATPKFFGHQERYARLPPPPAVVLESVLPQPLSQKVMARCFTQPHNALITFFATRILCVAFEKLKNILDMYKEAAHQTSSTLWVQAAERLTEEFCLRCPPIKDVIIAFRRMKSGDLMQKEAVTKLLVLYYEVAPQVALDAKFGVSTALAEGLQELEDASLDHENRAFLALELEHLFEFAHFSPGMRWFHPTEGASLTPFVAMLKLAAEAPDNLPLVKIRAVLSSIAAENQIFQNETSISALDTFIMRLRELNGSSKLPNIYTFLDDCISRCAAKPVKYLFALEELAPGPTGSEQQHPTVSLLTLSIAEQWPFFIKSADEVMVLEFAKFLAAWLAASIKISEDKHVLKTLIQNFAAQIPETSPAKKIVSKARKSLDDIAVPIPLVVLETSAATTSSAMVSDQGKTELLVAMRSDPNEIGEDHSSLVKWTTKEVDEVIEDGHAKSLVMLLSSDHLSVRKEALTNISKFAAKLKTSSFEEKEQIWLLFSEIVETARKTIDEEPLPTFISAFAAKAISVLKDPLHVVYGKMNKFLSKGPTWQVDKLPLMHKILDEKPTLDDAHHLEVDWLLSYMLTGLRTEADMAIYRRRLVFEKLLSLYNSRYLRANLRDKILRIVLKASAINGGSTTLITRFSALTWLEAQNALGGGMSIEVLMDELTKSCDQKRVSSWKRGGKSEAVDDK